MDAGPATAIVIAGGESRPAGEPPESAESAEPARAELLMVAADGALVVAADSGLARAAELGLDVDVVVGDFDSVDPAALDAAMASGVSVERHPVEKDATDLELAMAAAVRRGATRVVVVDAGGGRLDLSLANLLLLASPDYAGVAVEAVVGQARVHVVRDRLVLHGRPGERLSLLPVNGPAVRVATDGLRYPLLREDLPPGTTRGCSNELVADTAVVSLEEGVLLCVLPGPG
jgi:thiamine pyrophosphokinase